MAPVRLTLAIAAALVVVLALHYAGVGPEWPAAGEHLYELVEAIAAGCCLWRAATHRKERTPWLVIGLGMLSFAAAELYYTIFLQNSAEIPYPSLADALYLGLYPCCFAGLLLLALYYRKKGGVVARSDRKRPYKRTLRIHLSPGPHHVYARVYYKRKGSKKLRKETVKRRFTVCA